MCIVNKVQKEANLNNWLQKIFGALVWKRIEAAVTIPDRFWVISLRKSSSAAKSRSCDSTSSQSSVQRMFGRFNDALLTAADVVSSFILLVTRGHLFYFSLLLISHSWRHHQRNCKVSNIIGSTWRTSMQQIRQCPKFTLTTPICLLTWKKCWSFWLTRNANKTKHKISRLWRCLHPLKRLLDVNVLILCWTTVRLICWPIFVLRIHHPAPVCAFWLGCDGFYRAWPIHGSTTRASFNRYRNSSHTAAMRPDALHPTNKRKSFICWRWPEWFARIHCYCICFCRHTSIHWRWQHLIHPWAWRHRLKIHYSSMHNWRRAFDACRSCTMRPKTRQMLRKLIRVRARDQRSIQ